VAHGVTPHPAPKAARGFTVTAEKQRPASSAAAAVQAFVEVESREAADLAHRGDSVGPAEPA